MKLVLIRHGETKEGKKRIILGNLPGTLTTKGKIGMRKIAKKINSLNLNPKFIISSNLKRTKDSAKIISKITKLPIKYEKLIRERRAGKAEGKSEKEIDWKSYEKMPLETRKHIGGESFINVKNRAEKFLQKIKKYKNTDLVVISHNAFILMLLSIVNNCSIKRVLKYKITNKLIIVEIKKG